MSDRRPLGDEVLVHRAARRVAVQAAVAVALAIVLLVLTVTWVVVRGQARTADTLLRSTVSTADDAGDPPPGAWLVIDRGGQLDRSSGLPARLGPELAELRGRATAATRLTDLDGEDGRDYRVATERRGGTTVQVVLDLTSAHDDRTRLLRVMAVASLLGLLFAVLLGILLGRRAVRPLAEALRLQRTFVADASHELRTPLTLLSTRAQVLDRGLAGSEVTECVRQDSHGLLDDIERLAGGRPARAGGAAPRRPGPAGHPGRRQRAGTRRPGRGASDS
jgi:two-component system OmpR family sensor kinase